MTTNPFTMSVTRLNVRNNSRNPSRIDPVITAVSFRFSLWTAAHGSRVDPSSLRRVIPAHTVTTPLANLALFSSWDNVSSSASDKPRKSGIASLCSVCCTMESGSPNARRSTAEAISRMRASAKGLSA